MYLYRNGEPTNEYERRQMLDCIATLTNEIVTAFKEDTQYFDDWFSDLQRKSSKQEQRIQALEAKLERLEKRKAKKGNGHARTQQKGRPKNLRR